MIDFTVIRKVVETVIVNNFTECPIKLENSYLATKDIPEWIAVFDKTNYSDTTGMGEETYLLNGIVTVQINTKLNTGTERAKEIAKSLSDLFNSKEIEGIAFHNPELYNAPETEHWYRHHLVIRYTTIMGQTSQC